MIESAVDGNINAAGDFVRRESDRREDGSRGAAFTRTKSTARSISYGVEYSRRMGEMGNEQVEVLVLCGITGICVAASALVGQRGFHDLVDAVERDLRTRLRWLRVKATHLRGWIYCWLGILLAAFLTVWSVTDALWLAGALVLVSTAGPWYLIRRMAVRRHQQIEDQLADAMVMFSASIRAGLSLAQALDLLALECPKPIRQEFSQIINEYKMGKPMERTLRQANERLQSENFSLFSAALLASRESGGRLNETVERISNRSWKCSGWSGKCRPKLPRPASPPFTWPSCPCLSWSSIFLSIP